MNKIIPFPNQNADDVFRFVVYEEDGEQFGQFVEPRTAKWRDLTKKLDYLLDGPGCEHMSYGRFEHECKKIIKEEPLFLDAYGHIAMHYLPPHPLDDVKAAARWYRKGFNLAKKLIPEGFSGRIEWNDLDNRPFLRIHHGLIICALRQKKDKEAIALMEQHLAWNPNDNIGVRYLIGEAYLRKKKTAEARKILEDNASNNLYPPSIYSLALLEFSMGQVAQALTWLRRGITENPYIAEALISGRIPVTLDTRWHKSNYQEAEMASYYLDESQELWAQTPFALFFLSWAFNCSRGLRERANFAQIAEALADERDFAQRGRWLERESSLTEEITDETSYEWLGMTPAGKKAPGLYPWERAKSHT